MSKNSRSESNLPPNVSLVIAGRRQRSFVLPLLPGTTLLSLLERAKAEMHIATLELNHVEGRASVRRIDEEANYDNVAWAAYLNDTKVKQLLGHKLKEDDRVLLKYVAA